ncbi:hypothetical protein B0X43_07350 [Helicobacter pylori]|nr:hypothetical protein B0X43_07350 [Helicobacter pylori]
MILGRLACKVSWIYPEDTEVLGVACKSLLKVLKPRYQKIALFSPINGGCEGLNSLEFHSTIDKQKALELVSVAQEELLFETILKRYDELQSTHDFVINLRVCTEVFLKRSFRLKHHFSQAFKRSCGGCRANEFGSFESHAFSYSQKRSPFRCRAICG